MASLYAHSLERKSLHLPSASLDDLGRPPTPRPRSFIAQQVIRERAANGSATTGMVLDHVDALPDRVPRGRAGAVARGAGIARVVAHGLVHGIRALGPSGNRWGVHEGRAEDLLRKMFKFGLLRLLAAAPSADAAGKALMILSRLTPLVQVVKRGVYRIFAGDPGSLPAEIRRQLTHRPLALVGDPEIYRPECPQGDAADAVHPADLGFDHGGWGSPVTPEDAEKVPACGPPDPSSPRFALRVCGVTQEYENSGQHREPAADQVRAPSSHSGGLGCAPAAPAEKARASTPVSPASPAVALTASAWQREVSRHPRQRQAADLVRRFPDVALAGYSPSEAARALLNLMDSTGGQRVRSREVGAVARGFDALRRQALLTPGFGLPTFAVHPALEALGVPATPGPEGPTAAQARWCRRVGIDPIGLSRSEATALQDLVSRGAGEDRLWRFMERLGCVESFAVNCGSGRLSEGLSLTATWLRARPEAAQGAFVRRRLGRVL